ISDDESLVISTETEWPIFHSPFVSGRNSSPNAKWTCTTFILRLGGPLTTCMDKRTPPHPAFSSQACDFVRSEQGSNRDRYELRGDYMRRRQKKGTGPPPRWSRKQERSSLRVVSFGKRP